MGMVTAAVVGGAIMAGGSYLAGQEAAKGAKAQADAANAALAAFQGVPIPSIEEQKIILQNPDLVGQYTPEQVQAMEMGVSAMENVHADQGTIDAQNQALQGISEVAKGGLTEADKSASRQIEREVGQQSQARQKAILNSMAQRGVLGSGMELAAQLQGNQQSLNEAGNASDRLIQAAQARSLQALTQQGALAGQMRGQQFGEQADVARARDAINQFNTQNRQSIANTNTGESNRAQLLNLQQRQSLEDQRAAMANQQLMHNKGLIQTQYANRRGQAQDIGQAQMAVGNAQAAAANARAAGIQGIAQGVGSGLMGYAGMQNSNEQAALNRDNALAVAQAKKG